jgi:rhodanese-related sulfurtransferase
VRTAARAAALAALALAAGAALNLLHPRGVPPRLVAAAAREREVPWNRITVDSARALFGSGRAVFVDIRERPEFDAERVPGALSLPFLSYFRAPSSFERGRDPDSIYVVYAFEPSRPEGRTLLARLRGRGFARAAWMYGGLSGWLERGYEADRGPGAGP